MIRLSLPKVPVSASARKKIIVIALIILGIASVYFYGKSRQSQSVLGVKPGAERQTLIEKVGKIVELPQDETPSIATVSDVISLKHQPFFKNAENGDKVLIYAKARKAILYRPSTNKVIEIIPITPATPTPAQNVATASGTILVTPAEQSPLSPTPPATPTQIPSPTP